MMNFKTTITGFDVTIFNFSEYSHEIENAEFTVSWTFELETREWGVKDVAIAITDIQGEFDVVYYDLEGNETSSNTVTFSLAEFKDKVSIELDWTEYRSLSPNDITIDYKAKKVEVS